MVPSPKTTCTRCGAGILQITADLTEGHCMPCAKELAREDRPLLDRLPGRKDPELLLNHHHPAADVILSVDYHPGWSPDLTSWVIQISQDGVLRQAICWHRARGGESDLLEPVILAPSDLAELQQLVGTCAPDSFRVLADGSCIDDAAMVSLVMPGRGVKASVPFFHLEEQRKDGRMIFDEAQAAAFHLFRQLWRFADRHAPYSLRQHEKKNR